MATLQEHPNVYLCATIAPLEFYAPTHGSQNRKVSWKVKTQHSCQTELSQAAKDKTWFPLERVSEALYVTETKLRVLVDRSWPKAGRLMEGNFGLLRQYAYG